MESIVCCLHCGLNISAAMQLWYPFCLYSVPSGIIWRVLWISVVLRTISNWIQALYLSQSWHPQLHGSEISALHCLLHCGHSRSLIQVADIKGSDCLKLDPTPNPQKALDVLPTSCLWHSISFWLVAPWSLQVGEDDANRRPDGIELQKCLHKYDMFNDPRLDCSEALCAVKALGAVYKNNVKSHKTSQKENSGTFVLFLTTPSSSVKLPSAWLCVFTFIWSLPGVCFYQAFGSEWIYM